MKHIKAKNFFVLLLSLMVFFSIGFSMVAHADDDEDEEDDDRYEQQVVQSAVENVTTPQKVEKPKTVTKTIVDPPTTIVTYQIKSVDYPDSDRDGLIDSQDPHPTIAEIYFVKDDNFNGIVDSFEYFEDDDLNGIVDTFENYNTS